jgi:hypothetical protein
MEQRPEQPPEGKLIAAAAERQDLSIREAARRAGISYGRWRQIVTGYQNVSPGSYAPVHAPARTLAKMAAVVRVTPEQMETEGERPDAAAVMREQPAVPAPAAAEPAPLLRKERLPYDQDGAEGLHPYLQEVRRELYAAIGLLPRFPADAGLRGGPDLPAPWELPEVSRVLEARPGAAIFDAPHEARFWDTPGATLREKEHNLAMNRKMISDFNGGEARNAVLSRA